MSSDDNKSLCCKCNQKLQKDGLKAMGKLWHSSCFLCVTCKKCVDPKVVGKNFYEKDGKPYCETDFLKLCEECCVCQKPITGPITVALNKNYHTNCFLCVVCKKPVLGPYRLDPQNSIYCVEDYRQKFAPKCLTCNQAIAPEGDQKEVQRIQVFGNSYHINCFKCEECKSVLKNDTNPCFPLDKKPLCKKCFRKRNTSRNEEMRPEVVSISYVSDPIDCRQPYLQLNSTEMIGSESDPEKQKLMTQKRIKKIGEIEKLTESGKKRVQKMKSLKNRQQIHRILFRSKQMKYI